MLNIGLTFIVLLIGVYGICTSRNIIKSILSLNICQTASVLLILNMFYSKGDQLPIRPFESDKIVDPLPQAFMITNIVIGASITSIALLICIKLFHHYGSLNWHLIFNAFNDKEETTK